jgi:TRAP-type transport system periplasmic protein
MSKNKLGIFVMFLMLCLVFSFSINAEKIEIKYAFVNPQGNPVWEAPMYFAKKVEELSNGRIVCKTYPAGQLGGESELIQSIKLGTIQMIQPSVAPLTNSYKKMGIYELPFLFSDQMHLLRFTRTDLGKLLEKEFEAATGLKVLDYIWESNRGLFNDEKPVYTPADMKGKKIRVMEGEIWKSTFEAVGALPVPLAYTELYSALATNLVDFADPPISSYNAVKFYEVAQYYTLLDHAMCFKPIVINAKFFNKLSPEDQKIIEEAIHEAADYERNLSLDLDKQIIDETTAKGAKVNYANKQAFKEVMGPVYDKWREKLGNEFMDEVLKTAEEVAQ